MSIVITKVNTISKSITHSESLFCSFSDLSGGKWCMSAMKVHVQRTSNFTLYKLIEQVVIKLIKW